MFFQVQNDFKWLPFKFLKNVCRSFFVISTHYHHLFSIKSLFNSDWPRICKKSQAKILPRGIASLCGCPSDYVILSYDFILMMTSYLVVTALVKLFVKIRSLNTMLNDLIGNIGIDFDVKTWDFYVLPPQSVLHQIWTNWKLLMKKIGVLDHQVPPSMATPLILPIGQLVTTRSGCHDYSTMMAFQII